MAQQPLPPDYFRTMAELYREKPSNRKVWLADQIGKANASLIIYQQELNELAVKIAEWGGAPSDAKAIAIVGGVVAAIPAGYTQVVGGLLIVASSFFAKSENKKKEKTINELREIGMKRNEEAIKVAAYKTKYEHELLLLRIVPFVLTAILIWLILK